MLVRRSDGRGVALSAVAYEMSIEVLDGDFPAELWMEARGDVLVEVALQLIMAKTRHRNPRTAMRSVKPGGVAVAEVTELLDISPRRR